MAEDIMNIQKGRGLHDILSRKENMTEISIFISFTMEYDFISFRIHPNPLLLHPWLVPTAHPSNPSPKIPNPLVLRQTRPLPFPLRHTNAQRLSANTSYHTSPC